jgi:hypothetical protein
MRDQGASEMPKAGAFTAESVLRLLGEVLPEDAARLPHPGSPALSEMTRALNNWQWLIATQRGAWRTSAQLRQKLVDALIVVDQVIPPLRAELVEALGYFEQDGLSSLGEDVRRGIEAMDTLARGVSLAGQNAPLLHISTRLPPFDQWHDFAGPIEALFHCTVTSTNPAASQLIAAGRRFVFKVIPDLTGENPMESTVASHMKKKTPVNRGKRPL